MAESPVPPATKRRQRPEKKVEITDPKAIRALAHAARLEVISELYSTQVSRTATELAAQTGLTPSAMSYHLRALQKWGIVVPAATAGDARERRWKAAGTDFTINSGGGVASPEFAVLDLELDAYRRRVNAYAKTRDEQRRRGEPTDGPSSVVLASNLLYLTPEQRALMDTQCRPLPPLAAGPLARNAGASALMDISDGLVRDGARMAAASHAVLDLDPGALKELGVPLQPAASLLGKDPMDWVLGGGEDHGLLAAFPAGVQLPPGFTAIGSVGASAPTDSTGVTIAGRPADTVGWDHFAD